MEERVEISVLMDFYGNLLTDKQKEIMDLYFNDDLSLAEISEITNTSRQAIHDIIKRCHKLLLQYEAKLGLMSKSAIIKENKTNLLHKLNTLKEIVKEEQQLKLVNEIENDIINNI